jgi:hypothetical protein
MRHLRGDIEFAEELAIEHVDAHRGPRSQKSASEDLNTCLAALLEQIARSHGVSRTEIIENFGHPSIAIAIGEQLPFVLLYLFLSAVLVKRVFRRYPPEDGLAVRLVMILLSSLAAGIGGLLSGVQLAQLIEAIRVGNGHMSYRADRIPWAHYQASLFGLYFVLFWTSVAVRFVRHTSARQIKSSA